MNSNLSCNQVEALINFYIEGKLNPALKKYVDIHLESCPSCTKKIRELKNIFLNCDCLKFDNKQHKEQELEENKELIKNLSAYIDNELNITDNIKIKKMTVSNPQTRKKLEKMYQFQRIMHSAYEKTKNDYKFDYSKNIISFLTNKNEYSTTYFKKIILLFIILVIAIFTCFIYLYF